MLIGSHFEVRLALSPESLSLHVRNIVILIEYHSGDGQEVGAWENSVWEGYKRWERKGREVGVLKGWKVG